MKYVIQYTHDYWSLGCDCCTDILREIEIYDEYGTTVYETIYAPYIETEEQLREYITYHLFEYINYTTHPDTKFA